MRPNINLKLSFLRTIFLFLSIISYGCGSNQPDNEEGVTGGDTVNPDVTGGSSDGGSSSSGSDSGDTGGTGIEPLDVSNLPGGSRFPTYDGSGGGSGGSSGGGYSGGFDPGSVTAPGSIEFPGEKTGGETKYFGAWRGMRFEFNTDSCDNYWVYRLGQYSTTLESDSGTTAKIKTVLQHKNSETGYKEYKYRSYYTKIKHNTAYIQFYQGSYTTNIADYDTDMGGYFFEQDISATISSTFLEGKKVAVFLSGIDGKYSDENNHKVSVFYATIKEFWNESLGTKIPLLVTKDMQDEKYRNSTFTIYYTVMVYDPDFVWMAENNYTGDHYYLESSDCGSSYCGMDDSFANYKTDAYGNDIPDFESAPPAFITLWGWGFENPDVKADEIQVRALRGYASLKNANKDGSKIEINGEVHQQECGLTNNKVYPMNKINTKTFLCKDTTVCETTSDYVGWQNASPDSGVVHTYTINLE